MVQVRRTLSMSPPLLEHMITNIGHISSGYNRSRQSWDPLTMLYALEGPTKTFKLAGTCGHNFVYPNGTNAWMKGNLQYPRAYLELKAWNETVAAKLENSYLQGAARFAR